jgi:hypothetical protein
MKKDEKGGVLRAAVKWALNFLQTKQSYVHVQYQFRQVILTVTW